MLVGLTIRQKQTRANIGCFGVGYRGRATDRTGVVRPDPHVSPGSAAYFLILYNKFRSPTICCAWPRAWPVSGFVVSSSGPQKKRAVLSHRP